MAGVLGEVVHEMVKLGPDEVQGAGVAQGPPLRVDHDLRLNQGQYYPQCMTFISTAEPSI